ncbi:prolipoprotein diacylglyceryl transferase [Oceanicaulis sp. MMSF_3324]|uniref:prolipoprotein diacylglyceryl transferase n=1 Tax=Oceanicaulis sp. MMSF_3324 TaxID=3046702 RepID=UPI00273DCCBD|nr:prolipoprotein diacylglyceryl transferase [Oceanicaulis sp. MMSF_3324]
MIGACPASFDLIDPVLFTIPKVWILGPFPIRWYALAYIAGLFGGLFWVLHLIKQGRLWGTTPKTQTPPYARAFVDDLVLWIMIGVIAGGRLGYVLFYNTSMIWETPVRVVTGISDGGMSFHGGLIGVTLAMVLTARAHKAPLLRVSDAVAAATPIGLFFGRMANFINGELYGRPAPDLLWAMRFAADPTCQLRHPSQLYEAALEGLVLFVILTVLIYRFRALSRPGLLTGAFLAGYGVFRAFVELFREPDRQMPEALQGYVTMGMVLCIPMIALGAYLIWRARQRPAVGERPA